MSDSVRRRGAGQLSKASTAISDGDNATGFHTGYQRGISISDVVRILITVLALSLSLSYYLTSGDSLTFNYQPWFIRPNRLKAYFRGPLYLTPTELSLYNGTAYPQLPILLSINSTIFDVSGSPQTYGPGGSYHIFAGRDASRAFVTGCFQQDLTADLRGVERMFLPVDDDVEDTSVDMEKGRQVLSSGERKIRAEQESREAKKKVRAEVDKWARFYRDHEKYFQVGHLLASKEGTVADQGVPDLCDSAEKSRPKRSQMAKGDGGKSKPVFKSDKGKGKNSRPV